MEEILSILNLSKNDKSLGPDKILVEVYRSLYEVLGLDLLRVIEDSRKSGKIPVVFNTTFLVLIPKSANPSTFDGYRPISLCNFSYKIIGKILSTRIKKVLGRYISYEQFGFLPGRQIHDAVGVVQEGFHSIHSKGLKSVVLKTVIFLKPMIGLVGFTYMLF